MSVRKSGKSSSLATYVPCSFFDFHVYSLQPISSVSMKIFIFGS